MVSTVIGRQFKLGLAATFFLSCSSEYEIQAEKPNVNPGDVTDCPFTPIPNTKLSQYDCNPVFPNDEGANVGSIGFHVTEILGHPFYQMWYGSNDGIEYAVSNNGTDWDRHPSSPLFNVSPGTWDETAISNQVVVWDPIDAQYVLSYQGYSLGASTTADDDQWGIGISTSPDGENWTKHPNNPAINFQDYSIPEQDYWNYFCSVASTNPSTCSLMGITYSAFTQPTSKLQPCWPLTITMSNRGNFKGYIGAKNSLEVLQSMDWAKFENDLWSGNDAYLETAYYPACHVYSMDAMAIDNWVINDNQPTLSGDSGSYDGGGIASASVVDFEGTLYMFYVGFETWIEDTVNAGLISGVHTSLNLATSTDDGATWVKDPGNPFPVNLTDPGEISAIGAQIIGSRIHLWLTDNYSGNSAVGYFYYEPELEQNHP